MSRRAHRFVGLASLTVVIAVCGMRALAAVPVIGVITTLAGTSTSGYTGDGAAATAARLDRPAGVAVDAAGNVYIADSHNSCIRKVTASTGIITTVAGSGTYGFAGDGGAATAAQLSYPTGVAVDGLGNLYIADYYNYRIRKVTAATGIITTVAGSGTFGFAGDGGAATTARLSDAADVAVDGAGNLYIADLDNNRVRKVTAATGVITTLAGDGTYSFAGDGAAAFAAQMRHPSSVAVDTAGNVYIGDDFNNRVRKVTAATGIITTVAGNGGFDYSGEAGAATSAALDVPTGLAVDGAGNLYIADNQRIRKVTAATGLITTVAGSENYGFSGGGDGGPAPAAQLYSPAGVAVDRVGNLYIADFEESRVRKVTFPSPPIPALVITTIAGTGTAGYSGDGGAATVARLACPVSTAVDAAGSVYVADFDNNVIRRVSIGSGVITTFAGNGTRGFSGDGGAATTAALNGPLSVAVDGNGNVYIADNQRIRKVAGGVITTVAGNGTNGFSGDNGPATAASLSNPNAVAVDGAGNLYIADNNRVRKVTAATGVITTLAGSGVYGFSGDGAAAFAAQMRGPQGVAVDGSGNVYIADTGSHRIRKVAVTTGIITTVAGTGSGNYSGEGGAATSASFYFPKGLAVDGLGNVYIADSGNERIRKLTVTTGLLTTVAGNGRFSFGGDGGVALAAGLSDPSAFAVDGNGGLYIPACSTNRVRKVGMAARTRPVDYDGDGKADIVVYRPSSGTWFILQSSTGYATSVAVQFGMSTDVAVPADYDGDGTTDIAVYRPSAGAWLILTSSSNFTAVVGLTLGATTDVPVPGDYDGDGKADPAVYRPSTGTWYVLKSRTSYTTTVTFGLGLGLDIPVPGDYDGDGKTDVAVYRPSSGIWHILHSSTNFTTSVAHTWGISTDIPVPGDYDGDGKTDIAVYRPSSGVWYILKSSSSFTTSVAYTWGISTDIPVPGDYDGDETTDMAVYRPESGTWFILKSDANFTTSASYVWGISTDFPPVNGAVATRLAMRRSPVSLLANLARASDFDGDGRADISVFRPSSGTWFTRQSGTNFTTSVSTVWGISTDTTVPDDYDGDGKTDLAVYRPSTGIWYILESSSNFTDFLAYNWGISTDIPVPGDYDGDGKADIAVYRPSSGVWYILQSSSNFTTFLAYTWGVSTDIPVPGDYDGDGNTDIAVYRPSSGTWFILKSGASFTTSASYAWGINTDIPVAGDYDGDGTTDIAVYRPSSGTWFILKSGANFTTSASYVWGISQDIPVAGDYDGDGTTDIAVYRRSSGTWFILTSGANFTTSASYVWGVSTDTPILKR